MYGKHVFFGYRQTDGGNSTLWYYLLYFYLVIIIWNVSMKALII